MLPVRPGNCPPAAVLHEQTQTTPPVKINICFRIFAFAFGVPNEAKPEKMLEKK
jgi:hypothetical protein